MVINNTPSANRRTRFNMAKLDLLKRKKEAGVIRPRELKELNQMYVRRKWKK